MNKSLGQKNKKKPQVKSAAWGVLMWPRPGQLVAVSHRWGKTIIWSVGGQKDVRGFPVLHSPIPYPRLHGHVTPNASCVTVNNPALVKPGQIKANPLWIDILLSFL